MDRPDRPELAREAALIPDELLAAARAGAASARAWLDEHPEVWRRVGDLAVQAEAAWLELICGDDDLAREMVHRVSEALRVELAGPSPPPIVRLLAERAVSARLQAYHADAMVARNRDVALPVARYLLERQDRAGRRYVAALADLARVSKLLGGETGATPEGGTQSGGEPERAAGDPPRLGLFGA
jgi:hypothetical protein